MDVISLSLIMIKFMNGIFDICETLNLPGYVDFRSHFSAANLTYGLFKFYNSNTAYFSTNLETFKNPITRKFVRRAVYGGWVNAYANYVASEETIPLDFTSLYPSAMYTLKHIPDLSSAQNIFSGSSINSIFSKYIEFIVEVDILIPKKEEGES